MKVEDGGVIVGANFIDGKAVGGIHYTREQWQMKQLRAEIERLTAENGKMRAALAEIADYYDDEPGTWMRGKAQVALEQSATPGIVDRPTANAKTNP